MKKYIFKYEYKNTLSEIGPVLCLNIDAESFFEATKQLKKIVSPFIIFDVVEIQTTTINAISSVAFKTGPISDLEILNNMTSNIED